MTSPSQDRWDRIGKARLERIRSAPKDFVIDTCPVAHLQVDDLLHALGDLKGKRVLDLGCGWGNFSVWLAKQGAQVTAVDLSEALLDAARVLAEANGVTCEFRVADIVALPFDDGQFDVVTGIAILHHLSEQDVRSAIGECRRVLKSGGAAHFHEPVENSATFNFLQNLIPIGGGVPRPSILNRPAWRRYLATLDDRPMTDAELTRAGESFLQVQLRHYGFLVRLERLIGSRGKVGLTTADQWLFRNLPALRRYGQSVLVTYTA
jgi:2-polyprenyl-3-methyl-5-hydroxy-6-metoxy-1,4-benzoquinol methylase